MDGRGRNGGIKGGGRPVVSLSRPVNPKYNPCTSVTHIVAR